MILGCPERLDLGVIGDAMQRLDLGVRSVTPCSSGHGVLSIRPARAWRGGKVSGTTEGYSAAHSDSIQK
jgi:hypothetical protein